MDLSFFWLPLGLLSFILAITNLVRTMAGSRHGWEVLVFLSLSSGLGTLVAEYFLVNRWVASEDWAALMDVVPSMSGVILVAAIIGVILNGIVLIVQLQKRTN
ncbi:MAG TPA: hypothetical protein GXZ74_06605 [Tissierellia bacterium]|nr:hypothetical protein [Tissierellia bacterium]